MINQNIKERLSDEAGESRLLSSILRHGLDAFIEIEGIVQTNTMTCEATQVLWHCIEEFFGVESAKPTIASIIKYSKALGYTLFDSKNEKDWLVSLFNLPTEIQDTKILGTELKRLQIKRELVDRHEAAINNLIEISTLEPLSKIVACSEQPISDYVIKLSNYGDEGKFLKDVVDIHIANLFDNPNTVRGIKTGYSKFDNMIGGSMEPGTFHVIVARSGCGKSIHAANTAVNIAKQGNFVILADLELDEQMTMNRILASMSGVNGRKFSSASFTEEDKDKINDAVKLFQTLPIYYINVSCKEIDETLSLMKRILSKKVGKKENNDFKDCAIIYDYLRLNDSEDVTKNLQEHQALGFHAIKLKNTALQTKIPLLTYLQSNRSGIKTEDSSVAASSDRVLWLADSMSLLKRKSEDEILEDRAQKRRIFNRKMIWIKARNAEEGQPGEYINYDVMPCCRLEEGPTNVEINNYQPQITTTEADKQTVF